MLTLNKAGKAHRLKITGWTWEAIAERYGCSPELARAAAAQYSRRKRIRELVQVERNEVRRLVALGEKPSGVAAAIGMRLAAVAQLTKNGGQSGGEVCGENDRSG